MNDATKETVVIRAGARAGKTERLVGLAIEASRRGKTLLVGIGSASTTVLRSRALDRGANDMAIYEIGDLAAEIAALSEPALRFIDEPSAYGVFERAAAELFAGTWPPQDSSIETEVAELRSPERFLEHAWTLVQRLRRAEIAPGDVIERAAQGATAFYAHPPNLSSPTLLSYLNDAARSSLDVDAEELLRQHRREIDLAKILAELYARFESSISGDLLADRCAALSRATLWLQANVDASTRGEFSFDAILVDDAEHCDERMHDFLNALALGSRQPLTLACNEAGAHRPLQGARIERLAGGTALTEPPATVAAAVPPTVERCTNRDTEAQRTASWIAERIAAGTAPEESTVLLRDLDDAVRFEEALHERGIATARAGQCNLFRRRDVLDAFALLCWIADPFAHDALLRILEGRRMALSDATIATLCGKAASAQDSLFGAGERAKDDDRPKALRLGDNILSGAVDPLLGDLARERVSWLRTFHGRGREIIGTMPLLDAIAALWDEGLAPWGEPTDARERSRRVALEALQARIAECDAGDGLSALRALCEHLRRVAKRERTEIPYSRREGFVTIAEIDAVIGISFEAVAIPSLQAGAFPAYYVPPAFLFTPTYGLAARENAGGLKSTRAAKHAYVHYRYKLRERHIEQERRLFAYARSRARTALLLTASGRPTRGINTPEFLEEYRR
ncbi:MAG: ATP-dependent helicase [Candidatus Eremiobacteraeota bacterium]|nr:ATP-dependent helicase [Candidatus Eremiobacteraeota bacterium]